ncbi:Male sterility, NAD-binding,NAD(P)-binding domain,Fatty acyl-CoA reductase, C-terminal [Cinara cedri]|uniref:Fatty acyl-CoA reductase n=1 Tax=Cinara cedri TaxID=506608 RepID=A0A5E4MA43_9HEMI|nr:Male sterility, NAD-binding,NAD(P)-binding domain,Fatty acyl-CoA reductase, C-terminal [Cinara cedri]
MQSNVAETFRNGTALVTGCTGVLGKLLTEKLLRSCPVKTIAIIVRNKKEFTAEQRAENIYKETIFDCLREKKPNFMNHIKVIDGYLEGPDLGISSTDREWIIENVNFVFHCAATVRFNEPLEKAIKINIQGTEKLLALATEIKNIKGFVHVSTAYSNFYLDEIKEQFYPVPITAKDLYDLLDIEDSSIKNNSILRRCSNTYYFTKAITENLISTNDNRLPISIFRPSIIGCTQSEPFSGWVKNLNAATGVIVSHIIGMTTFPMNNSTYRIDIIPIDYTVNALISVMWDTVQRCQDSSQKYTEPKIFNFVSGVESPLTYADFFNNIFNSYREAPPLSAVWYYLCIFTTNPLTIKVLRFLLHTVPNAFMDLYLLAIGKKPKILKMYGKLELSHDLLRSFVVRNWTFHNNNTRELWSLLSQEDRKTFWYSFEEFDFKEYIKIYVQAVRKCILDEDQSNIKEALAKTRSTISEKKSD